MKGYHKCTCYGCLSISRPTVTNVIIGKKNCTHNGRPGPDNS